MIFIYTTMLVILPAFVYAEIKVNIVAANKTNERQVHIAGSDVAVITDEEAHAFGLTDEGLKNAVAVYFGEKPTDAFLHSPTPWGDLYKTYGWAEVTKTLTPIRARILGVKAKSEIIMTQYFNNTSSEPVTYKAKLSHDVQNTIASSWSKSTNINVTGSIDYGFSIVGVAASLSYTAKWGESVSKIQTITIGSESGLEITLKPNESAVAELSATQGVMQIQIDYETSLTGSAAVNYFQVYNGHHFWSLGIDEIMSAAGFNRTIKSTETIEFGYYSNSKIIVRDSAMANFSLYSYTTS